MFRSSTSYKLKNRVLVSDMWVGESVADVSELGNLEPSKSLVIGWPTTNFIATFSSKELRDRWEDKLKTYVEFVSSNIIFYMPMSYVHAHVI